jgi:hypothetical protein
MQMMSCLFTFTGMAMSVRRNEPRGMLDTTSYLMIKKCLKQAIRDQFDTCFMIHLRSLIIVMQTSIVIFEFFDTSQQIDPFVGNPLLALRISE